ncbi:MAG: hypothetical protein OXG13_02865 [Gemmatimonadaceae bacterium]|nr:hypothetical protein [Gemmatimonadaceae bacterium]
MSLGVQGVLCLNDTPTQQGAFISVPGLHRRLEATISIPGSDPHATWGTTFLDRDRGAELFSA